MPIPIGEVGFRIMRHGKPPILASLLIASVALLAACGGATHGGRTITLYSGQHEQTTAALVTAFEKQTAIKVDIRSGNEAELGNQILQESANSPADVFYTENTPVLEDLREKDLLAPVTPSTLAAVPGRYDSARGDWVGVSARVSALVYNTSKIRSSQLPNSILALAEPQWKGKLSFAPSETDFQPLVGAIVKLDGAATAERWLKGLRANGKVYPDNESLVSQVNNGESAIGPINHYYWYRLRAEVGAGAMHSALHYYALDDPGNLLDVSGAGVLKSSAHQADAQAFLAFLVSRTGQETIAHSSSYEYPLRAGVSPPSGLRPFATLHPVSLAPSDLGDGSMALAMEQKLGLL
jgi:iron(III) transport system substrate-binding protein